jgi:hypothetical protein
LRPGVFAGDAGGSRQHLVEVDGGGVGEHQLARADAEPGGELVAQAPGQVIQPALFQEGSGPGPIPASPRAARRRRPWAGRPGNCRPGRSPLGQGKARAAGAALASRVRQSCRVRGMESCLVSDGSLRAGHGANRRFSPECAAAGHRARSTARTGEASASVSLSGRAISS